MVGAIVSGLLILLLIGGAAACVAGICTPTIAVTMVTPRC